jgi:hypothetical protein
MVMRFILGAIDTVSGLICFSLYLTHTTLLGIFAALLGLVMFVKGLLSMVWLAYRESFFREQQTLIPGILDLITSIVILTSNSGFVRYYGLLMLGKGSSVIVGCLGRRYSKST